MKIIEVNLENIENEHICCVISDKKGETCVSSKKTWLKARFNEGLVFKKADVRGKVFIEYIPANYAWCPIIADGYMFINCFWVSGSYKGQGISNLLLEECISDSKILGMKGLVILSSNKKKPFLSDPNHLKYKGFITADTAYPDYELLYLPFDATTIKPKFKDSAKNGVIEAKEMVLYYTNQCPHCDKYAPIIKQLAKERGADVKLVKIESTIDAQNAPSPFTTYSFFYDGKFVTNEIFSEKKFTKFLDEHGF